MSKTISFFLFFMSINLYGQQWNTNGLNTFGNGNSLGTSWNAPINIYTANTFRAQFTTGNALTTLVGNFGDGLRIIDPLGGAGNLDLFTSGNAGGNETHARFVLKEQISGQNNRFLIHHLSLFFFLCLI